VTDARISDLLLSVCQNSVADRKSEDDRDGLGYVPVQISASSCSNSFHSDS